MENSCLSYLSQTTSSPMTSNLGPPQATSSPKTSSHPKPKPSKPKAKQAPKRLTIINVNCRSVFEKRLELKYLTDQTMPDIIAGTESWLTDNYSNNEVFDTDTYSIFRKDRTNRKGGGVFLAIRHCLNPVSQPDLDSDSEIVWAKLDIPGLKNVFVCSFYKPNENDQKSIDELEKSLSKIPRTSHIWALGDFNLPNIDWQTEQIIPNCPCPSVYESLVTTIHDFGLEQVVKEPTRGKNILDLFLLNQPSLVHSTQILPPLGTGDHDIVYHELKINLKRRQQKPRPIKLYKKTDWTGFREEMRDYQNVYHSQVAGSDTNTKWTEFKKTLNNMTEKFIPTKFCKPKESQPWVTREIKRQMNKRDKLYAKIKQNRSNPNLKEKFKALKHIIQKKLRQSYNSYIESIITDQQETTSEFKRPNKRLFTFIKQQKSDSKEINCLKSNGINYTDPVEKANILNNQFQSVFTKLVPLKLRHLVNLILPRKLSFPVMPSITVTASGVAKQLSKLNPGKAAGPDNLTSRILKELHNEIAPILTDIYNTSLSEGTVPKDWKNAYVTPVYKKGPKSKPENYRPISLTCICCKIIEHIITSNVMAHLDKNNLLFHNQHGFRSRVSCETQLIQFTQDLYDTLNDKGQADVIVMDFSKAFDKVDHQRLLLKLHRLGINHGVITWIRSFLSDRSQCVVLDGEKSDACPVLSGVPQGSVLGPCLFLMYINDMPETINSNIRLFADDTIMYLTITNQSDCLDLQNDLSKLEAWESEWLMAFNPEKCEVIRITKKHSPIIFDYKLHNIKLKTTKNAKYLGLLISDDLTWTKHINQTTAKGNNTLKFIKRNIQTHNTKIKETAYKTYVRPLLEYSSSVWDPWQNKYIKQLEMVQHRAARYILNDYASTSSVTTMLKNLGLPSLQTRRKISSLVMLYKIQSGQVRITLPPYITPSIRNRLSIPYSRINAHLYSFFPRTARLWNNLPPDLTNCPDLETFRAGLYSHFH